MGHTWWVHFLKLSSGLKGFETMLQTIRFSSMPVVNASAGQRQSRVKSANNLPFQGADDQFIRRVPQAGPKFAGGDLTLTYEVVEELVKDKSKRALMKLAEQAKQNDDTKQSLIEHLLRYIEENNDKGNKLIHQVDKEHLKSEELKAKYRDSWRSVFSSSDLDLSGVALY
jgi:hypothetical protein